MAINKTAFRTAFPEFASLTDYPDTVMEFWESMASAYVSEVKWSALYTVGMSLVLAHFLTIAKGNKSDPGAGNGGLISNQSVGDVSAGFDTTSTIEAGVGQWNLTTYGQQYTRMARLIGGVAMQL